MQSTIRRQIRATTVLAAVFTAALSIGALLASGAAAQSGENSASKLGDDLISCAGVEDDQERLACYDEVAQPLAGLEEENAEGGSKVIESFAGEDDWDSEIFEIDQPWRVTWQTKANILTIELYGPEGELLEVIGNQIGAGGGSSATLEPGRYYLGARGVGSWQMKVLPAEE